ncbi:MAG TPA: DUF4271 domain-containing protein [Ohtaekwangia sp.]
MKVLTRFILFFCITPLSLMAQEWFTRKDLRSDWKVYEGNTYKPFHMDQEEVGSVYFEVSVDKYSKDYLHISSSKTFSLFANGQLITRDQNISLKIDSLARMLSAYSISIAVHQPDLNANTLVTQIQSPVSLQNQNNALTYRVTHFRDFAILAMVLLFALLIIIIRLNPKLASDYFSIGKIFSMREGDDSQMYSRITSSTNILFYIFCSLLIGYCLIVIFHFVSDRFPVAIEFQSTSFPSAMLLWIKLSFITLAVFFFKISLVYGLTKIFHTPEVAGVHFFNWVRLLLLIFGSMTLILSVYFILYGQNENFFSAFLNFLPWILGGWMILILIKLSNKLGHSLFHLFSYICATEIIPFLITLKVLFS